MQWLSLAGLILLISPFISTILAVLSHGVPDAPRTGDAALLEISTRSTVRCETLTGPFSRLGFSHPGPAYFFLRAPVYFLSGFAASSSLITAALVAILSLAGMYRIAGRQGTPLLASLACLIAAAFIRSMGSEIWLNDWNAFVIIMPMLLLGVSLAATGAGNHRWLMPSVLAGSFAVQTHLGSLPTAAVLFAASVPMLLSSAGRSDPEGLRRSIIISAAAAVLVWLPVLYQQLSGHQEGNISRIVAYFGSTRPDPASLATLREWSASLVSFELPSAAAGFLRKTGLLSEFFAAMTLLRISLLVFCFALNRRNPSNRFLATLCLLSLLAHATTLLSVLQIRDGMHQYLLTWFSCVAPLSWIAIAGTMARVTRLERAGIPLVASVVLLIAVFSLSGIRAGTMALDRLEPAPRITLLSEAVSGYIGADSTGSWYIILGDHGLWPEMAGLVNDLQKRGLRFDVDPVYSGMTGLLPDEGAEPFLLSSDSLWDPGFVFLGGDDGVLIGYPAGGWPPPIL